MEIKVIDTTTNRKAEAWELVKTPKHPNGVVLERERIQWSFPTPEGFHWTIEYIDYDAGLFEAFHPTLGSIVGHKDGTISLHPTSSLTELVNSFNENVELTREKVIIEG
jgi:hypothetical protein